MAKRPGGVMVQGTEPTRSQLIPVITKWTELGKTAQLGPVLFCILVFFSMATFGNTDTIPYRITSADGKTWADPRDWIYTSNFLILLAVFLTMVSMWFIYRMIGKNKSWYILVGAAFFSGYYLWLMKVDHDFLFVYEFFHLHLAGGEPDPSAPFIQLFIQHFLGTGFFEELVKALPIFALVGFAGYMTPEIRAKIGVEEPLDGILIGAASGGGFALMETLLQYAPRDLVHTWMGTILRFRGVTPDNMESAINTADRAQALNLISTGSNILGQSAAANRWRLHPTRNWIDSSTPEQRDHSGSGLPPRPGLRGIAPADPEPGAPAIAVQAQSPGTWRRPASGFHCSPPGHWTEWRGRRSPLRGHTPRGEHSLEQRKPVLFCWRQRSRSVAECFGWVRSRAP